MKERRAYVRVRPDPAHPIKVQIVGNGFIEVLKARDISVGGLAVQIPHDLDLRPGQNSVELVISLPGSKPFAADAEIRHEWSSPGSRAFGIEFKRLSDADKERIQKYVEQRTAEGGNL
jgi:c-di-GMP-binding flagellar brake protein YcgR